MSIERQNPLPKDYIERKATYFVHKVEQDHLMEMASEAIKRKKRAETCNCISCIHDYEDALQDFSVEKFRIENPHEIDEEEIIIDDILDREWSDFEDKKRGLHGQNGHEPGDPDWDDKSWNY